MAMEGFSELIRRLNDAHEREVEGLREKIQELTNKKGGDCKRMEELFNRNQQLREQQRLLTDNIKQLENRLRAGLCDRCSVTQDVARRRQQEYESSQIQSLQHISLLAAEVSVLKQRNRRLREDLRAVQESQGGSSSQDMTSEVRQSPDLSPPATPLVNAGCKSRGLPVKGNGAMKTELDQTDACATEAEQSHQCGWTGRQSLNSYKPLPLAREAPPPWRTELGGAPARAVERRTQSLDIIRQSPIALSIPSHLLLSRSALSSSSLPGQDKSSRHQVLVPVPYRPRPLAPSLTLPWPLAPPPDWAPREGGGSLSQAQLPALP
ncbi:RBBP8 N-terminal-like protein isoform X1 [Hypomesus transpacificus]|uniref:RBBP8 N-terminal-like protein isoform X1 n=3 Tax=Hypomesus transpacificus TaxID=137520 RepID=UPI001F08819C|nr:RBBP8 N-terminal-like protein isoform X1 [Hypomesus transpacificus]XP_046889282.1 RBBP8 N-terminal-like protein isoform X1 [Hypomesus transpacificus]XP_046889283.1 RBBP8 N-terminal-like protein isoform X1 [Hypomesus transpacificus]XP_046889284.1 RBBP8 N-terminal-like protein isoform X1 [Hypomesus transpacificus]XP_046889285.1 RBBP8 N-terminal-like protein isoform X1 [Hypomesus transpacificus]XP_046889286.1 RBBP8 N-terminal-like protein isoform X1 [Hypomesus transpacificus]